MRFFDERKEPRLLIPVDLSLGIVVRGCLRPSPAYIIYKVRRSSSCGLSGLPVKRPPVRKSAKVPVLMNLHVAVGAVGVSDCRREDPYKRVTVLYGCRIPSSSCRRASGKVPPCGGNFSVARRAKRLGIELHVSRIAVCHCRVVRCGGAIVPVGVPCRDSRCRAGYCHKAGGAWKRSAWRSNCRRTYVTTGCGSAVNAVSVTTFCRAAGGCIAFGLLRFGRFSRIIA